MGYALLWLEALAGELLLWVMLVACLARIKWRLLRNVLVVLLVIVALAAYAVLICVVGQFEAYRMAPEGWARPFWALIGLCAVGAIVIPWVGMRRGKGDPQRPAAATWPWGKLAVALAVALALNMMTFWNLDAGVKQRAAALRVEAGALALSVAPARVPDRDNAAVIYEKAFELMGPEPAWQEQWDDTWTEWLERGAEGFDPQDPTVRKFLEDQAPTLAVLRQVVNKPACYFPHDYARPSIYELLPEMVRIRQAAWALALDARCKLAAGDVPTAIDDVNTLFAMTEHAGTVPLLVAMLVAARVEQMAVDGLEQILASGEVSAEQLGRIHVPEALCYRRLYDRAIRMEEAFGLSTFYEFGLPLRLEDLDIVADEWAWVARWAPLYRVFLFEEDVATYHSFMWEMQQLTARPMYEVGEGWPDYQQDKVEQEARGLLTKAFLPALPRAAEAAAQADARHRLAQFAHALAFHRAGAGALPDDLEQGASMIRPDPFDGKPLKWTSTDEALVLYSVGPNRKDDGGKPFDRETKTGDLIFTLPK